MAEARRRTHKDGEANRRRILDAAAAIAGERGYEGTTISLVSERSGLPASSIYWHFADKDELIAAVVEASYREWVEAITTVPDAPADLALEAVLRRSLRHAGEELARFPDFLRLGLMLLLERRPTEPAARERFRAARADTLERVEALYAVAFAGIDEDGLARLATFTLAAADGLFIAADTETRPLDLGDEFELLAAAVLGAARALGWDEGATTR